MRGGTVRIALAVICLAVVGALVPVATASPRQLGCAQHGCLPTPTQCAHGAKPVTLGVHVGSAAACVGAHGHTVAYAGGNVIYPCGDITVADADVQPGDANACDGYSDDPLDLHVYTPSGTSTNGLPSLYLLTGSGGKWSDWESLGFDPQGIADTYRAVVVAIGGQSTFYVNWVDGTLHAEDQFLSIVRSVDAAYGTARDRAKRALLGYSMGGYGALLMGERHPDLFGNVVSLSGLNNIENRVVQADVVSTAIAINRYAAPMHVNRIWGDPIRHAAVWHAENPTAQVCGLRHNWVWFSSGDGVPSKSDLSPFVAITARSEALLKLTNHDLAKAMRAAGLHFTYRTRHGTHDVPYWLDDMTHVLPTLMHRLTVAAPSPQPAHTRCG